MANFDKSRHCLTTDQFANHLLIDLWAAFGCQTIKPKPMARCFCCGSLYLSSTFVGLIWPLICYEDLFLLVLLVEALSRPPIDGFGWAPIAKALLVWPVEPWFFCLVWVCSCSLNCVYVDYIFRTVFDLCRVFRLVLY